MSFNANILIIDISRPDAEEDEYEIEEGDGTTRWRRFRTNAIQTCQILLGRSLEEWEKEMFLFPRSCRRCHVSRREGMLDCPDCMGATYCSQQCRDEDKDTHEGRRCMELRFAMACDNFECSVNVAAPALPSEVDAEYTPLPKDVEGYLDVAVGSAEGLGGLQLMERKFLSDRVSGPMTAVHAMQKFGLANGKSAGKATELTVHIVGANIMEMLGLIKWELIAHKLPKCSDLRVIFIGPELEGSGEEEEGECEGIGSCQDCSDLGRTLTYEIRKCPYQDYSRSQHYRPPDLVAAFNCGFHEFRELPEKDTWKPALPYLVRA